jgi:predicted glycogen debranching enzyme
VPAVRITFGTQVCGDLDAGASREWLVADGLGGYAMGTVCGLRTRRYHALLVVAGSSRRLDLRSAQNKPAGEARHVGLVALDPVVTLPSGATVRLGTHEWVSGAIAPDGYRFLQDFTLVDGLPSWRWRIGDVLVERELAMVHGQPSVAVVDRLLAGEATLAVEALCTWRDVHGERHASGGDLPMAPVADGVAIADAYRLSGPGWQPAGRWYLGAHTRDEAARGLGASEDLWYAGSFSAALIPGGTLEVSAWAGDLAATPPPPTSVVAAAHQRARVVIERSKPVDGTDEALALAAAAFVVDGPDVVAGYPWFGAWSRDTMISYEGLFLETGRTDLGRDLLTAYAETLSEGMLANTADTGRTEYNTVDATLWFVHAIERHVTRTGDTDLAAALVPALDSVVAAHVAGTRYDIRVDPADGLLAQGADGYALTWMDARVDGVAVTPRTGKPVEINALWVNALGALAFLRTVTGSDAGDVSRLRDRAEAAFRGRFPAPTGWLYDVVDGPAGDDPALRPNQLLAWSLPRGPGGGDRTTALAAVGSRLLTPLGLRSLAPDEPGYRGRHRGGPADRDTAYHQGTVWPWLIGRYADLVGSPEPLAGLEAHLSEWGLGSVSETADGDPPHAATGCPFQAWSVAEVLRARRRVLAGVRRSW